MASTMDPPRFGTVADLIERLGGIPAERIRLRPTPGEATEEDLLRALDRENRLCELIDGVLVEKTVGLLESRCMILLGYYLIDFLKRNDLGVVLGADGPVRLFAGQVRMPDISFVSWARWPKPGKDRAPILNVAPDLAVEILSKGNTRKEMARKLREYFEAGVLLVWYADPKTRTVQVFRSIDQSEILTDERDLDGGDVLPGFRLSIRQWFDEAAR